MSAVPWFMLSPSPVSLIQYAVLTWIMWGYLSRNVEFKKHARLHRLINSFFIVAFFVVLTDAFWVLFSILKWLPLYPGDALQICSSLGRDIMGAALFYVMIGGYFKQKILHFNSSVIFWMCVCFISQAAWFFFSPSPGFTDYTFAWRYGYPVEVVAGSWFLSHFIMRIPLWFAILKTRNKIL